MHTPIVLVEGAVLTFPVGAVPTRIPLGGALPPRAEAYLRVQCTPDGRVCVSRRVEGDFVLFVRVDPSTGVAGDVFARVEPDGGWTRLDWSLAPDGSRIAVVRENLWLRTHPVGPGEWSPIPLPEGVVPQRVGLGPDDAVWVTAMVERPDGGNDGFRLLGSTPDGGWSTPYSTTNLWIANPEPSPDGRYVAFDSTGFDTDLWSVAW